MSDPQVTVIGGGLAGCEAAWQLASRGITTRLYEMRPEVQTGAHRTGNLAELVCSNSFKSKLTTSASGELKREMRYLGSMILDAADEAAVDAGEALAVDREVFADAVTSRLESLQTLEIIRHEVPSVPEDQLCIIATGPLTSPSLAEDISSLTGSDRLYFYDAVAPIVETDTLDFEHCYEASRYDKGDGGYLNCPISKDLYFQIVDAVINAQTVPLHDFEDARFFEGCLPLEEIARRGPLTLAHGPWKPVGLRDPRTSERAFAVLQLRKENAAGTCYSLVACQSRMTWPEQKRIFMMIPALKDANFLRLGVVHRNTYLDAPRLLDDRLRLRSHPDLFFAGQIVGVEGYLESAATGILTGINAALTVQQAGISYVPPVESMLGALVNYVSHSDNPDFAPMNANFGILPPLEGQKRGKADRRAAACERAFTALVESYDNFLNSSKLASINA